MFNEDFVKLILSISIFFFSLPTFWVGLIMIMIFSVSLNIFPSTGRGDVVDFLGYKWCIEKMLSKENY